MCVPLLLTLAVVASGTPDRAPRPNVVSRVEVAPDGASVLVSRDGGHSQSAW